MSYMINNSLSEDTLNKISSYIKFPEEETLALDLNALDGRNLKYITKSLDNVHRYGASQNVYAISLTENFYKVCKSHYKVPTRITNFAFPIVLMTSYVHNDLINDVFYKIDPYLTPDFEKEERARIQAKQENESFLDFDDIELTQEQKDTLKNKLEEKIMKSVEERKKAHLKHLVQQSQKMDKLRDDLFLLNANSNYIKKNGLLIMITPKEFLDGSISAKLANAYKDVKIFRVPDEEYQNNRKCIIFATKRTQNIRDYQTAKQINRYQYDISYKDIPVIEMQSEPIYNVYPQKKENVFHFRVGPITEDEALIIMRKSNFVNKQFEIQFGESINEVPKPPAQLREGHVSLCLASGLLNGYVGSGPDQHLVKGSIMKRIGLPIRDEDGTTGSVTTRENEYFHPAIKYLDRYGNFHQLL